MGEYAGVGSHHYSDVGFNRAPEIFAPGLVRGTFFSEVFFGNTSFSATT
ncbi:MAG: hypothetical protein ACI8Z1_001439 [Candidatus Azotimanducaceae bacterium]